jgi:DNA-directed RNA polymerase subunit RPC12/RpoP
MSKPKILIFDVETAPVMAFVWQRWKVNVAMNQVIQDNYVLSWSAKWLGEDTVHWDALYRHKDVYAADPTDDSAIMETLWDLLDEADYVVAHNGNRFDIPVVSGRFLVHGMQPPSTYQSIDTLLMARRCFKLTSHRLDDLGNYLGVGRKIDTGGFELWSDVVLHQDMGAFKRMVDYNIQDVELLESVYLELRPWDKKHPSTVVMGDLDKIQCNTCGSERVKKNGSYATNTQIYQKYKCTECGHNMRSRQAVKLDREQRANLLRSN